MEKLFREGDRGKPVAAQVELLHHVGEGMGIAPYLHYGRDVHALSIPPSASSRQSPSLSSPRVCIPLCHLQGIFVNLL